MPAWPAPGPHCPVPLRHFPRRRSIRRFFRELHQGLPPQVFFCIEGEPGRQFLVRYVETAIHQMAADAADRTTELGHRLHEFLRASVARGVENKKESDRQRARARYYHGRSNSTQAASENGQGPSAATATQAPRPARRQPRRGVRLRDSLARATPLHPVPTLDSVDDVSGQQLLKRAQRVDPGRARGGWELLLPAVATRVLLRCVERAAVRTRSPPPASLALTAAPPHTHTHATRAVCGAVRSAWPARGSRRPARRGPLPSCGSAGGGCGG